MLRHLVGYCALLLMLHGVAHAQTSSVSWANERLTVRAVNAPLAELVTEVAAKAGMTVVGLDKLSGRRSIDLADLSLGEALPKLLEDVNYLVTRRNGMFQIRIHSMSGSVGAQTAETGPLHVPGLTDQRVGEHNQMSEVLDLEEVDEDEQDELIELEEIGQAKGAESLQGLLEAMTSDFVVVRVRAVQLLAHHNEPAALAAVISALRDEDVDVSLTASEALAEMPGDAVVKALFQQLAPKVEVSVQGGALRTVALRADIATIPLLQKAMPSIHPQLQEVAAVILKKLEDRAKVAAKAKG